MRVRPWRAQQARDLSGFGGGPGGLRDETFGGAAGSSCPGVNQKRAFAMATLAAKKKGGPEAAFVTENSGGSVLRGRFDLLDRRENPVLRAAAMAADEGPDLGDLLRLRQVALDEAAGRAIHDGVHHLVAHGDGGELAVPLDPRFREIALKELHALMIKIVTDLFWEKELLALCLNLMITQKRAGQRSMQKLLVTACQATHIISPRRRQTAMALIAA